MNMDEPAARVRDGGGKVGTETIVSGRIMSVKLSKAVGL